MTCTYRRGWHLCTDELRLCGRFGAVVNMISTQTVNFWHSKLNITIANCIVIKAY